MRNFVALLRDRVPGAELQDLAPALDNLRLIKSESEIDLLRRAGKLTAIAIEDWSVVPRFDGWPH